MKEKEFNLVQDLKKQHKELLRSKEQAHNRHSGTIPMSVLKRRRGRRRWKEMLKEATLTWNQRYNKAA